LAPAQREKAASEQAAPNALTPREIADGWVLLFDGQTLFGWQTTVDAPPPDSGKKMARAADLARTELQGRARWRVEKGTIVAATGTPEVLTTTSQFDDYALSLEVRDSSEAEPGVFLRAPRDPSRMEGNPQGCQVRIAAGGKQSEAAGGAEATSDSMGGVLRLWRDGRDANSRRDGLDDRWQSLRIEVVGDCVTATLHGETSAFQGESVAKLGDSRLPSRGCIGLPFDGSKVEYRNIKLKPRGMKPLFDGKTLAGWRLHPQGKSQATVTPEGTIHLTNGLGQLETTGAYGDFLLQLDVLVNGSSLNSGVFFRSIPGQMQNGYESQIHNGFKNGDRTKPADCGTGGIFRRQEARKVVADDRQWFTQTIVADGPHMAVWVNGYQVSDWTDRRAPHENPRKGLRTAPGTILFQGHDATTDLYFRNIRIGAMGPSKSG
jgi:hypothetical protein